MSKKFFPIEPLDEGCMLGKKATGKNAYWYVRMYWKAKGESEYRSTKIPYEESRASRLKAKRRANAIWQEFLSAVSVGDNPRNAKSVKSVADDYKKQYRGGPMKMSDSAKTYTSSKEQESSKVTLHTGLR